jgi:hypothetical protein
MGHFEPAAPTCAVSTDGAAPLSSRAAAHVCPLRGLHGSQAACTDPGSIVTRLLGDQEKPFQAYSEEVIWYFLTGFICAVWILLLGTTAWSLLRKPPRSPAKRVRLFGRVLLPVSGAIMAFNLMGQQGGWLHDGAESTLSWTALAFSAGALVWAFGQDRLMAVLAARAAAKRGQVE